MPVNDARDILARTPFFAEVLSPAEIAALAVPLAARAFPAGEALLREEDEGSSMFILVDGEVSVIIGTSGKTREVTRLGPGDIVGEMSLMTGARRSATVAALTPVTALEVAMEALEPVLNASPELVHRFAAVLERRQAELDRLYGDGWSLGLGQDKFVTLMRTFFAGL